MFDRITGRFKRGVISLVFAILILGLVMVGTFVSEKISMSKGVTDFNQMKFEDFKKGRFVQGEVMALTDGFAEEYEQRAGSPKKTTSIYYLMPLYAYDNGQDSEENTDYKYVVVGFSKSTDITRAGKLINETNKYINSGEEPLSLPTFTLEGKISHLSSDVEDILYDTLIESGWGNNKEECSKYICPYYIKCKEGADLTNFLIGIVLTLLGASGSVLIILKFTASRRANRWS